MPERGILVVLAGGNGVGKDTLAPLLAKKMTDYGTSTISLYGPAANSATNALQNTVLNEETTPNSRLSQALAYFALHSEVAETVVVPILNSGESVVLNRGPETTLAYNVLGRKIKDKYPALQMIYDQIYNMLQPNLVIVLDTSVEVALSRAAQQPTTDHFQQQALTAHEERRQIYLDLAKKYGWTVVDATPSIEEVLDSAWSHVLPLLR